MYSSYHTHYNGAQEPLKSKYNIDLDSDYAWRYFPENGDQFATYDQFITQQLLVHRGGISAYIAKTRHELSLPSALSSDKFRTIASGADKISSTSMKLHSLSIMAAYSPLKVSTHDIGFFIFTPFLISRHKGISVLKVCKKLNSDPSGSLQVYPQNYLMKISDAHTDTTKFDPQYVTEHQGYFDPSIDLKTQCEIWRYLMHCRRQRGAPSYPNYYFSTRKDLSKKGNFLKQYLFMPMLNGGDFDRRCSPERFPDAKLFSAIIQSMMDLCILHECLERIHGDIAHGGLFNKDAEFNGLLGSNIFLSTDGDEVDGVLIDFESSVQIGQANIKYSTPYYMTDRDEMKIANPYLDVLAFAGLLSDLGRKRDITPLKDFEINFKTDRALSMRHLLTVFVSRVGSAPDAKKVREFIRWLDAEKEPLLITSHFYTASHNKFF